MNINFYKKILTGIILTGLVFNIYSFPIRLNKVFAQATPAATPAAATIDAVQVSDLTQTSSIQKQNLKENLEKRTTTLRQFAVMLVKKLIINRIVDLTAQWIQRGGFEGKGGPIVQDWNAFFKQAEDDAIGELANKYVKVLCAPFQLNAALFLTPPPSSLSTGPACTLNQIVANVDNFFKDFAKESNGRWIAYNTIWEPQNNYFGTILNLEDAKESKLSDVKNQQNVKATVNLGFQPQVKCTKDAETGKDHCVTITPGQTIATKLVGPATGELQTDSLLASSDISNYVAVLADAIIYRYQMLAVSGLQGMLGSKDRTDKENTDLCNRCSANPNLPECSTASCMDQDLQKRYDMIAAITFNNDKALYMDDIDSMLTAKSNTYLALNNAKKTETEFAAIYGSLDQCNQIIAASYESENSIQVPYEQLVVLQSAGTYKSNVDDIVTDLGNRSNKVENQIFTLNAIKEQFNSYTSDQVSSMEASYANLVANGVINVGGANAELNNAQTEATDYANALENQKTTNADLGGFKDVLTSCTPLLLTNPNP